MRMFSRCFREYICHIFVCVFIGVVDYLACIQISTVVIANFDVISSSCDDSRGDMGESTLIAAVDWQWWRVILRTVNILLQLE